MITAGKFANGRGQAVWTPKEYRIQGEEGTINQTGDIAGLTPKENKRNGLLTSLNLFSDDFMCEGREQSGMQEREEL